MRFFMMLILGSFLMGVLYGCSGGEQDRNDAGQAAEAAGQSEQVAQAAEPARTDEQQASLTPEEQNLELCRSAAAKLGGALKAALQEAMGQGGPVEAIAVCHDQAEAIAERISREEGLVVGRTSLKIRNPANAPDGWERAGLIVFKAKKAAGEFTDDLEMWTTVTDPSGENTFRYLKGIGTSSLCLKCHGSELEPDLAEKLDELYPGDKGRGFAAGDLRGAFTVSLKLPD